VVARLVRLGKKREPKKLPNKVLPRPPTKKVEAVSYEADASDPPQPKKKKEKPDRDATLGDRMRRSLDKAALFEAAQAEIEAEGDPSGVVGGTATEAGEGDAYMTRIADLWNRTWTLPVIIPREEAKQLSVLLVLKIDREGTIEFPIAFDKSSGNDYFDSSIRAAWQEIRRLPLPPPDRMASILANGLALKLTWKGLQ
jgi:phenylpropionate dioxygenase-like ring-hydroxylating dioxygenase large terminal subunit